MKWLVTKAKNSTLCETKRLYDYLKKYPERLWCRQEVKKVAPESGIAPGVDVDIAAQAKTYEENKSCLRPRLMKLLGVSEYLPMKYSSQKNIQFSIKISLRMKSK